MRSRTKPNGSMHDISLRPGSSAMPYFEGVSPATKFGNAPIVRTMAEAPPSVPDFLLNAPLYKSFKLDDKLKGISDLSGRGLRIFDGHCPCCGQ